MRIVADEGIERPIVVRLRAEGYLLLACIPFIYLVCLGVR